MQYDYKLVNIDFLKNKSDESIIEFFRFNGIKKFDISDILAIKSILIIKKFNVSYNIERLDKEFDLVKVGNNKIVNIELKLSHKELEQCKKNYEILKNYYKDYEVNAFCYEKKQIKYIYIII